MLFNAVRPFPGTLLFNQYMEAEMRNEEFGQYIQAQVREINAYIILKKTGGNGGSGMCENDLALEWIYKYAAQFRNRWDRNY